jgi:hypothetical protein
VGSREKRCRERGLVPHLIRAKHVESSPSETKILNELKNLVGFSVASVLGFLCNDHIRVHVAVDQVAVCLALRVSSESKQAVFGGALKRCVVPH